MDYQQCIFIIILDTGLDFEVLVLRRYRIGRIHHNSLND